MIAFISRLYWSLELLIRRLMNKRSKIYLPLLTFHLLIIAWLLKSNLLYIDMNSIGLAFHWTAPRESSIHRRIEWSAYGFCQGSRIGAEFETVREKSDLYYCFPGAYHESISRSWFHLLWCNEAEQELSSEQGRYSFDSWPNLENCASIRTDYDIVHDSFMFL
jgi:hypothetical protein